MECKVVFKGEKMLGTLDFYSLNKLYQHILILFQYNRLFLSKLNSSFFFLPK
jgi:hypothetical protein